ALTDLIWNTDTSALEKKQYQSINQGFRLVGSGTKRGYTVTAWKFGDGKRVSLDYLNSFVEPQFRCEDTLYHSKLTLADAKNKYPEWYKKRIVEKKEYKKKWKNKRALYDWWLRKLPKAKYHHRFFYVFALAIYGVKCDIPYEEVRADAFACKPFLNRLAPEYPFTDEDIESALLVYTDKNKNKLDYKTFTRDAIQKMTGIDIPPNKRNGRSQEIHLARARAVQKIDYPNNEWVGRKSYKNLVFDYLDKNPKATAKEFCRDTGKSERVFYKYKKIWKCAC
ncbi:MAG: hypothetical protein P1P66_12315, partial [Treponema pedis]